MKDIAKDTLEIMQKATQYNSWLFSKIKPHLGGRILEVGSGIGSFTLLLKEIGEVWAGDINKNYLKYLKKRFAKEVRVGYVNIEKKKYFFGDMKFDCVVCLNVLEHIKNEEKALKNIHKLLKKGGKLILLVPAHKSLYSEFDRKIGHYRRYSLKEVSLKLNYSSFKVLDIYYLNFFGVLGWLLFFKLLKFKKMSKFGVRFFNFFAFVFLFPERLIKPFFGLSVFAIATKKNKLTINNHNNDNDKTINNHSGI